MNTLLKYIHFKNNMKVENDMIICIILSCPALPFIINYYYD